MNEASELSPPARVCAVDALVTRRIAICREHVLIEFVVSDFPASAPGQFLQLRCMKEQSSAPLALDWPDGSRPPLSSELWDGGQPFLRRPFSIADRWVDTAGRTTLAVISRAIGTGTRWLDQLEPGQTLNVSGPFGTGFRIPANDRPLVLMGGGVGIPPLLYLARRLHEMGRRSVTLILGATTRALFPVPLVAEPAADGTPRRCAALPGDAAYDAIITTDDGSLGLRGFVTTAIECWQPGGTGRPLVLACGPDAMLHAVAAKTRALGWDCQLCIETMMGCGMGTCLSCVVRVRDATKPGGVRWALACSEGPVFERDVILDD